MKNLIANLDHVIKSLEDASGMKDRGLLNWDQIMHANALRLGTIREKLQSLKVCIGCDQPHEDGLCSDCEGKFQMLEDTLAENGLALTEIEVNGCKR